MKTFKEILTEAEEKEEKGSGKGKKYDDFFAGMLKKWKIKNPSELSKEDKKKFFDEVDAGYEADNETD